MAGNPARTCDLVKRRRRRRIMIVAIWLVIFAVIVLAAGRIDAFVAIRRAPMFEFYPGNTCASVVRTPEGDIICSFGSVPDPWTEADVWATVTWSRHHRAIDGLVFTCRRWYWRHLSGWRSPSDAGVQVALTDTEIDRLRPKIVAYLKTGGNWHGVADEFLQHDFNKSGLYWPGIVGNGAIYSILITPVLFVLWWYFALKRERRLRHGKCPRCGYQIRGLPEHRCPECAETWNAAEVRGVG
jgi:hypothetical protein